MTELHSSCCRITQICLERQPHEVAVRLCAALKCTENELDSADFPTGVKLADDTTALLIY